MLVEYFNSKSINSTEPERINFTCPGGELIHIWKTEKGKLGITRNNDDSYTFWNFEKMTPISHLFNKNYEDELFTRNYRFNKHRLEIPLEKKEVQGFAMAPNGETAAIALQDSTCVIWDLINDRPIMRLVGFSTGVVPIEITADGNFLIISQYDPFW